MDVEAYWDNVHRTKTPDKVSWFKPHLETSLSLIEIAKVPHDGAIIDVGCGASTLFDDLLDRGYTDLTCMDISGDAYEPIKRRLGKRADELC
ncbi:MAG TPA: hypothetical protein VGQ55_07700 [Pyrinomonadaceae bacterium]|jgi:hypothetical protein|nr:hypothetical protein [Pyrinomonadaceae bacterium]